ncbi:MAG TPA: ARMT1-like domain-containing protein [Bacteroidales bacterium]|nr:ARMT1-like domain-containing protein [Bacteroidales bacterium]
MISDYRCFYCLVKSFGKLLEKEPVSAEVKNNFTLDMINLYRERYEQLCTPGFARDLHAILKSYTKNPDPYKTEKREGNMQALEMVPGLQTIIDRSEDPFITAMRMSIAGNIMDFAANHEFDIEKTLERSLYTPFAIDHSEQLRAAVKSADSILYLGDNAGEIVFDKLFIKTIAHKNITYAVRGMPVINDVTMVDAEQTGMHEVARVISNGYDAPSTLIDKSGDEFRHHFFNASLIISKGQGNLEGLITLNDSRIFFLLMVKCDVMADFLKVDKGSLVVYNSSLQ